MSSSLSPSTPPPSFTPLFRIEHLLLVSKIGKRVKFICLDTIYKSNNNYIVVVGAVTGTLYCYNININSNNINNSNSNINNSNNSNNNYQLLKMIVNYQDNSHTDAVLKLKFNPNGTLLAIAINNLIYIMDPKLNSSRDKEIVIARIIEHTDKITSLCWSTDGKSLFSGDSIGNVYHSILSSHTLFSTPSLLSCSRFFKADSYIVQLIVSNTTLYISSLTKVFAFNFDKPIEKSIGKASRSGIYGVCFDPYSTSILAARPGKRIWRASENEVQATLKFNMISPSKFYNNFSTITNEDSSIIANSNFSILTPYLYSVLSWSGPGSQAALQASLTSSIPSPESTEPLFLLNPEKALVTEWWNDLGYIADLSISNDKIFLLNGNVAFDVSVMIPIPAEEYIRIQLDNLIENSLLLNLNVLLKCEAITLEYKVSNIILLKKLFDFMFNLNEKENSFNLENNNLHSSLSRLESWIQECSILETKREISKTNEIIDDFTAPPILTPNLNVQTESNITISLAINNSEATAINSVSNFNKLTQFAARASESISNLGNASVSQIDAHNKVLNNEQLSFPSPVISSSLYENKSDAFVKKKRSNKALVSIVPLPPKPLNEIPIVESPPSEFFDSTSKPTVDTLINEFISKTEGKHSKKPSIVPRRLSRNSYKISKEDIDPPKIIESNLLSPVKEKTLKVELKVDPELFANDALDECKPEFELKSPVLIFETFPLSEEEIHESLIKTTRSNFLHSLIEAHSEIKSIRQSILNILPFPFNLNHSYSFDNLFGFNISSDELFIDDVMPQSDSLHSDLSNISNNISYQFMCPLSGFSLKDHLNPKLQVCSKLFTESSFNNQTLNFIARDKLIHCFKHVIELLCRYIEVVNPGNSFLNSLVSSLSSFQSLWVITIMLATLSFCLEGYVEFSIFAPIYGKIVEKCDCIDLNKKKVEFEFCVYHFVLKLNPHIPQSLSLLFVLKHRLLFLIRNQNYLNSLNSSAGENNVLNSLNIIKKLSTSSLQFTDKDIQLSIENFPYISPWLLFNELNSLQYYIYLKSLFSANPECFTESKLLAELLEMTLINESSSFKETLPYYQTDVHFNLDFKNIEYLRKLYSYCIMHLKIDPTFALVIEKLCLFYNYYEGLEVIYIVNNQWELVIDMCIQFDNFDLFIVLFASHIISSFISVRSKFYTSLIAGDYHLTGLETKYCVRIPNDLKYWSIVLNKVAINFENQDVRKLNFVNSIRLAVYLLEPNEVLDCLEQIPSEIVDKLPSFIYRELFDCANNKAEIKTVFHEILESIDTHLWTVRSAHLCSQIRFVKDIELEGNDISLLDQFVSIKSIQSPLPMVGAHEDAYCELNFKQTEPIPRSIEEANNHWGIRVELYNIYCPACTLPIGETTASSIVIFQCNHIFHTLCCPEKACGQCYIQNQNKYLNLK